MPLCKNARVEIEIEIGKRPMFRPKGFRTEERRLAKLKNLKLWHKGGQEEGVLAGSPLIICPSAGDQISKKMKVVCKNFKSEHNHPMKIKQY